LDASAGMGAARRWHLRARARAVDLTAVRAPNARSSVAPVVDAHDAAPGLGSEEPEATEMTRPL